MAVPTITITIDMEKRCTRLLKPEGRKPHG